MSVLVMMIFPDSLNMSAIPEIAELLASPQGLLFQ